MVSAGTLVQDHQQSWLGTYVRIHATMVRLLHKE
jgi:hypothetical protein